MSSRAPENEAARSAGADAPAPGDGDPLALAKAELAAKDRKILSLEAALAQRETEIGTLESTLAAVYASTTWKLGAPLRLAKRLLGRMTNPAGPRELAPEKPAAVPREKSGGGASRPANYPEWQRARRAERQRAASTGAGRWNYLFTVVIFAAERDAATALPSTLASLHRQNYRNIEVLIAGAATDIPAELADFSGHRGLFVEPALHPLELLASPAADRLWRGSHLMFARAGTAFDPDAFALFNAAINANGADAPDLIVCDHDRLDGAGEVTAPSLVPGWDPDLICAFDYIETAFVVSRALIRARRAERPASLHDWLCGIARRATQPAVGHVTEPLVHMPANAPQPVPKPAMAAMPFAVSANELPTVAIVIPNRNNADLLKRCLRFLEFENRFRPELVVVDNASDEVAVHALYHDLRARYGARIVAMNHAFNFSRMVNLGVAATSAETVLLLNNDVEITAPGLIEQIIAQALRPEVGVVGCRLLYPDGAVQHSGMILRYGTTEADHVRAEHVLRGAPRSADGYLHQLRTIRNYQSVTGALQAMQREVFERVGGFDEVALPVEFGDVDFCLRVRRAGWRVITLPLDGIVHHESATRGSHTAPAAQALRSAAMNVMAERWPDAIARDPFRNPWVDLNEAEARFPWSAGDVP